MNRAGLMLGLIFVAVGATGWINALHWKTTAAAAIAANEDEDVLEQMDEMVQTIERLERENASLRSLAEGGGNVPVEQEMINFVEELLGAEFASTPRVSRATEQEIADSVLDELHVLYGGAEGMAQLEREWAWMGLISEEQRIWPQVVVLRSDNARGTLGADGALVAADFDPGSVTDAGVLVQLLAEMLARQIAPPVEKGSAFDGVLAREALIRGAADHVLVQFRVRQARRLGSIAPAERSDASEDAEDEMDMGFSPWAEDLVVGLYEEGRRMVRHKQLAGRSVADMLEAGASSLRGKGLWHYGPLAIRRLLLTELEEEQADELLPSIVSDLRLGGSEEGLLWLIDCRDEEIADHVVEAIEAAFAVRFPDDATIPEEFRKVTSIEQLGTSIVLGVAQNAAALEAIKVASQ